MYQYSAKFVRGVDGDTVVLDIDLGFNVTVRETFRLYGINTPETHGVKKDSDEYKRGLAAETRLLALLLGSYNSKLRVDTFKDSKEKYGRYLATVYYCVKAEDTGEEVFRNVNQQLVDEGHAVVYLPK
jgi:micrococcal nuclease